MNLHRFNRGTFSVINSYSSYKIFHNNLYALVLFQWHLKIEINNLIVVFRQSDKTLQLSNEQLEFFAFYS